MTTTITYGGQGGQTVTFQHPSELTRMLPLPPLQPLSSWASELANFQTLCTAKDFAGARGVLTYCHLQAQTSDVPGGALAAFKDWLAQQYGKDGRAMPAHFGGAPTSWVP